MKIKLFKIGFLIICALTVILINLTIYNESISKIKIDIIEKFAIAQDYEVIDCPCGNCAYIYNKDDIQIFLDCFCRDDPGDCCSCSGIM